MTRNPSRDLAEFAAAVSPDVLQPEVEARARGLLLDYLGVLIGGSALPAGERAAAYASQRGDGEASVQLRDRAPASLAALANGMTSHALELDDVTNVSLAASGRRCLARGDGSRGTRRRHAWRPSGRWRCRV